MFSVNLVALESINFHVKSIKSLLATQRTSKFYIKQHKEISSHTTYFA
jgi:hypothetical protein